MRTLVSAVVAALLLTLATYQPAGADGPPIPGPGPDGPLSAKPMFPRLDSLLNRLVAQEDAVSASSLAADAPLTQGESVAVTVRVSGGVDGTIAFLEDRGIVAANVGEDFIEAYVPVSALADLSQRDGVLRVSAIVPPQPSVISQGTLVHGTPPWVARGFTGSGVKVGIIDVGFEGYSTLIGSELPEPVLARCYTAVGVFTPNLSACENGVVHGTAVAEAVVDIAPDVSLYVATPFSQGDLQSVAAWMVGQGVQVINMSLGWVWDGPGDGTSPFADSPLATVSLATTGAVWVNSAGNAAQSSWYSAYSDSDGDRLIEFEAGQEFNAVSLTAGARITVQVRWEDDWTAAARDLDLFLLNGSGTKVASSIDPQSGIPGQIPREWFQFSPPTSGTYFLSIEHFSGTVPQWVQLNSFSQNPLEVAVAGHSVENPAESANTGLIAVGAANWATPSTIEGFSSRGPTTDGRTKPDVTGADGGDSASSGSFFGTSQASPHVAGLAALVLQHSPELTPAQVADFLKANALPTGAVPNNDWGFGLAQLPLLTPGAPADVQAVPGTGEASVSWSAPPDGGSPIIGYTVESAPDGLTSVVDGQTLEATVTGLTNGTAYAFTVTATNAVGTGDPSGPSTAVTPQGPPGPPTGSTAVPGNTAALVSWDAPASDGGSPITEYRVDSDPAGHGATVDGSTLEATVAGLTNGVAYGFIVTASNVFGAGPPSATSTPVVPSGPPGPPLATTATPGDGQATVSWFPPDSDGGSPITQYTVVSTPGGHATVVDGTTLFGTVTGLTNGTAYTFTVTATNAAGAGEPSIPSPPVTPRGPPGAPADVQAVPGTGEASVSWSAPLDGGSPITQYTVESTPGGHTTVVGGQTLVATVTGLTDGIAYTFTVAATNPKGTGDPSSPSPAVTPQGPPGPPIEVVAVPGDAEAVVSWSPPLADGGSPITQFAVKSEPGGLGVVTDGTSFEATVVGLTNGTSYTFTVTAANAFGAGEPSAPSTVVVPTGPPGPPLDVTAVPGDGLADVFWSPPLSDGGSPVTQYLVVSDPVGLTVVVDGSTLNAKMPGLTNETAYTFTVTAANLLGIGEPSAPSESARPRGRPGPPLAVVAFAGDRQARVTWTAPVSDGGAAIEGYVVTANPSGITEGVDGSTFEAVLAGLANDLDHTFTVVATNSVGAGPPSQPSVAVAPHGPTPIPGYSVWGLAALASIVGLILVARLRRSYRAHVESTSVAGSKGT
ncbi:MAG: fibronectin type III domain-containing protein [Chloroflexi bacterium]|nr:fibronectin type III domain-containing protein [Chloroflexota bacterium]